MNTVVVIPARYGSTRLPAKPLRLIAGVPMVVRTARQAVASGFPVWVAFDDARIGALLEGEAAVATLAAPFDAQHSPAAATTVKVVCDRAGLALYFSRAAIPYVRDADGVSGAFPYLRHIGIYAYRVSALKRYPQLAPTPLEQAEKLEQLRFLEHGLRIAVGVVKEAPPPGVDCEADLQRVEAFLRGAGAV